MKIDDLPSNLRVYICDHVFRFTAEPTVFHREADGDFVCLCSCFENEKVADVHIVGFGHLKDRLKGILAHKQLTPGSGWRRQDQNSEWIFDVDDKTDSEA